MTFCHPSPQTPAGIARLTLAFIFFYHGLVPKVLFRHPSEAALIEVHQIGVSTDLLILAGGIAEIILGLLLILFWTKAWPLRVAGIALVGLFMDVLVLSPEVTVQAFNPVSLTIAGLALVWIALQESSSEGS